MKITRTLWIAAVLILTIRTAALLLSVDPAAPLTGDEPTYDRVARSLLSGEGYSFRGEPWVGRPPGWPIVLAGIYATLGDERRTVILFQGLFDAATALICGWTALLLFRTRTAAVLAFVMVALWPPFFRESRFMQTDPLFTLFACLTLASFMRFASGPRWTWAVVAGGFAGAATLVRPTGLLVIAGLLLGWAVLRPAVALRQVRNLAALTAMVALMLFPWALRNALEFGVFIPTSLGGGEQFFLGTSADTDGRWEHARWPAITGAVLEPEQQRLGRRFDAFERDRALMRAGIRNWRDDPGANLIRSVKRVWRLCMIPVTRPDRPALRWGFAAVLVALYVLALPRGLAGLRAPTGLAGLSGILLIALGFYVLTSSAFYTNSRYMEPARPIVLLLAAGTLARRGAPTDRVVTTVNPAPSA